MELLNEKGESINVNISAELGGVLVEHNVSFVCLNV